MVALPLVSHQHQTGGVRHVMSIIEWLIAALPLILQLLNLLRSVLGS